MKKIPLTQGKFAIVDDDDFERLSQYKWKYDGKTGYAGRHTSRKLGKRKHILMHREIIGTPAGMETDHVNGDRLDNQKHNLRACTTSENQLNRGKPSNNPSGYKGVRPTPYHTWNARLIYKGKCVLNKCYGTAEEAAYAYDEMAKKYFGDFAWTNFR